MSVTALATEAGAPALDSVPPSGDTGSASPGSAPGGPGRRFRLAAHPGWIVVAAVAAALVRATLHTGISNDAWWHWAAGSWMLSHHAVIRTDVFSYTVRGRPWVAEEWGYELVLAWLVRSVGGVGFWILSAGPCVAALLVSVARWRRLGAGMLRVGALSVVAGGYLLIGEAPRPQVASYLCFAVLLLVLTAARGHARWLVALPLLFAVWANLHGSFLAGLLIVGLDAAISRRRAVGGALLASTVATFVNPHGPGLLRYAWHVASAPQLAANISEWQSPNFHSLTLLAVVMGPAVLLVAALVLTDISVDAFDLILWGGLLLAGLHSQRFLPYAGLAWCGLAARSRVRSAGIRPMLLTWPLAGLAAAVLVAGSHVPAGAPARGGGNGEPVAAVRWLTGHPGRVFSEYTWDDYLIAERVPVFVDGRTDLYFGTGILDRYLAVAGVTTDPDPVLARWDVRYVLWPASTPLAVFLAHDPGWRVAFRSGNSVVFARAAT